MNRSDRYNKRYLGEHFSVSNDTWVTHLNNNDLIVGSSGSSKTGSLVYPQLKSLQDSSLIVVDTKGRLKKMFSKELKAKGYKVKVLDFVNPENSCRYNPLAHIRKNRKGKYREQDIAKVAAALVPIETAEESFWPISARRYLEFFIAFVLMKFPKEKHNMAEVANFYSYYMRGGDETEYVNDFVRKHPDSLVAKRHYQMRGAKLADKTRSSIFAFVTMALAPFEYAEYESLFSSENNLDIAALGKEKTVLFLNISDCDHSMDQIVNLFYTQTLQTLIAEADKNPDGQLQVPVRIIMDDFASAAVIPDFDKIISVVRSRDIWLTMCIQSFTQLESLYTHTQAQTIINNCDHIVYLGSNDLESAHFIGTRVKKSPETILCMDREYEYVLEAGKIGKLVRKFPSYEFEIKKECGGEMSA